MLEDRRAYPCGTLTVPYGQRTGRTTCVILVQYLFALDGLLAIVFTEAVLVLEYKRGKDAEKRRREQELQKRREDFLGRGFPMQSLQRTDS